MKRQAKVLFIAVIALAAALAAQTTLTNADVVKLTKAGMSEEFILGLVKQQPSQFSTDASRLVDLKQAGVSERLIGAMAEKNPPQEPLTSDGVVKLVKAGFREGFILDLIHREPASFSTDVSRLVQLKEAGVSERIISAMMQRTEATKMVEVPAGTRVVVRLIDTIDSEKSAAGDTFHASLEEPLTADGKTLAPRGADAMLKLVNTKESGKLRGTAELTVELTSVTVQGKQVAFNTSTVTQESGSRGARTAKVAGGTAAIGAIIGAIAGGGKGAAIGAGAGAAAGAGSQVFMKGQTVKIPSETVLTFSTETAVQVGG